MNKEIESIKTEIDMLSKGIKSYHEMVSDKLDSLTKRLDDLTVKEKPVSEIAQSDWMWLPQNSDDWWFILPGKHMVLLDRGNVGNSSLREMYGTYNVFKTKELAESRKYLSPLQRKWAFILDYLGRDEEKIDFKFSENKYFPQIYQGYDLRWGFSEFVQTLHKSQYTLSKEMCLKAIEIMGDDIYPYLGVDKP